MSIQFIQVFQITNMSVNMNEELVVVLSCKCYFSFDFVN